MAPPVQIDQASINVDLEWTNFMTVLSQNLQTGHEFGAGGGNRTTSSRRNLEHLRQKGVRNGKGIHAPSLQQINNRSRHLRADLTDRKLA